MGLIEGEKNRIEGQQGTLRSATWWDVLLWLGRRRRRWRVTGESMVPLLQPGEEVLMNPHAYRDGQRPAQRGHRHPRPGEIVVARHPQRPDCFPLIKRVRIVASDGRCHLEGDNGAASTDSRQFGLVPPQDILGQVVCRFP
ncbi:nickel-type superoxide dismutase maturation protease [Leptolyngbya sp. PCC 6406]|uniref:nickel-type superoxide dismutase maturation protease n=1 Tax=Leptolyngbya sp. PCC 6406 TaxID=1173264 RepID=UPI0002AC76F9|nr:nickel-type superoxide dismutase maturation protease [Leptolyngbya sp. PCC 6406]